MFGKSKAFNHGRIRAARQFHARDVSRISDIRLPASLDEDISLEKRFTFAEKVNAIFRMEAFNASIATDFRR